ncbi:unnamed protein product [Haemonchus placei]|uniref:Uncharacterized protein n=1 Tax=Haemonchus placei TaxID=6290 RepID=A0A0N4X5H9_HAEPC|nr:unnamed protein product [Haemonchus placei]
MVEQLLAEATADRLIRPSFPYQPIEVKAAAPLRNGELLAEIFRELHKEQRLPPVITAEEKDTILAIVLLHVILDKIQVRLLNVVIHVSVLSRVFLALLTLALTLTRAVELILNYRRRLNKLKHSLSRCVIMNLPCNSLMPELML